MKSLLLVFFSCWCALALADDEEAAAPEGDSPAAVKASLNRPNFDCTKPMKLIIKGQTVTTMSNAQMSNKLSSPKRISPTVDEASKFKAIREGIAAAAKKQILGVLPKVNTYLKQVCNMDPISSQDVDDYVNEQGVQVSDDKDWADWAVKVGIAGNSSKASALLGYYVPSTNKVWLPKSAFKKCQTTVVSGHEFLHMLLTEVKNVHFSLHHELIQGNAAKGQGLGWAPPSSSGDSSNWQFAEGEMCTDEASSSIAGASGVPAENKSEPLVSKEDEALNEMPGDRAPATTPRKAPPPSGGISDAEADRLMKEANKMMADMEAQNKAMLAAPPAVNPNKPQAPPPSLPPPSGEEGF